MAMRSATWPLLVVFLACAVYSDLRRHKITNRLNALALTSGLTLQLILAGLTGFGWALLGALVGLLCFLPFYLLRGMGAGDVKLLGAIGSFLGVIGVLHAALYALLAGGLGAIGYVLWRAAGAVANGMQREGYSAAAASAYVAAMLARRDRLPFAVPIAAGTLAEIGLTADLGAVKPWLQGLFT